MTETHDTDTVLVPTPQPVAIKRDESRLALVTKFLSWLTAFVLAVSVLVALINVGSERDSLQVQVRDQGAEIACRSAATFQLLGAQSYKQIAVADNQIIMDDFMMLVGNAYLGNPPTDEQVQEIQARLEASKAVLTKTRIDLEVAVANAEAAQVSCKSK